MASQRVAERYSRALLEMAIESSKVDQILADMKNFKVALTSSDLYNLLMNPTIRGEKKNTILRKAFSASWDPLTMKFVEVVTRKGREDVLPTMVDTFFDQYNEYKGITNVVVTSAKPLSEQSLQNIKQKLLASGKTKTEITLETRINPELIGGFVLEFNNNQYDASVRSRLNKLKNTLVN